jgi:hypothetical protein
LSALWLVLPRADPLEKPAPVRLTQGGATLEAISPRPILRFTTNQSDLSLQRRLELLRDLLKRYFAEHSKEPNYAFTFGRFEELNNRMAAIASCGTDWDAHRARSKSGNVNQSLVDQLNQSSVNQSSINQNSAYGELAAVFDSVGYRIKISSMESIALCKASEIAWQDTPRTCATPPPRQGRFPCGALITFELARQ